MFQVDRTRSFPLGSPVVTWFKSSETPGFSVSLPGSRRGPGVLSLGKEGVSSNRNRFRPVHRHHCLVSTGEETPQTSIWIPVGTRKVERSGNFPSGTQTFSDTYDGPLLFRDFFCGHRVSKDIEVFMDVSGEGWWVLDLHHHCPSSSVDRSQTGNMSDRTQGGHPSKR